MMNTIGIEHFPALVVMVNGRCNALFTAWATNLDKHPTSQRNSHLKNIKIITLGHCFHLQN
jgi:hypothetical protein